MRKRSPTKRLLLDKEIVKVLSTTVKVVGGANVTPSMPPEECANASQVALMCVG